MILFLEILGIYIVGVILSMIIIAYINAHVDKYSHNSENIEPIACLSSWLFILIILILIVAYPFMLWYDKLYNWFFTQNKNS